MSLRYWKQWTEVRLHQKDHRLQVALISTKNWWKILISYRRAQPIPKSKEWMSRAFNNIAFENNKRKPKLLSRKKLWTSTHTMLRRERSFRVEESLYSFLLLSWTNVTPLLAKCTTRRSKLKSNLLKTHPKCCGKLFAISLDLLLLHAAKA